MTNLKIDTVLFDLDGTLVEHGHALMPSLFAGWGHSRSLEEVKMAVSRQIHYFYNHVAAAEEQGWVDDLFRRFYARVLGELAIPDPQGSRAGETQRYFAEHPVPPLFEDVLPVVERLHGEGRRLGVITQRGRAGAEAFLEFHGLAPYFPVLVAGDDGHGRKPDQGPFVAALAQIGSEPRHAIYVGDRIDDDCEAAVGAGLAGAYLIDRDRVYTVEAMDRDDFVHLEHLGQLLEHLSPDNPGM